MMLDLDDVMCDTESALVKACQEKFPDLVKPNRSFEHESTEEVDEKVKEFIYRELLDDPTFLVDLPLFPETREALNQARQRGYEMHIVTGRFYSHQGMFALLNWLHSHDLGKYFKDAGRPARVHLRPKRKPKLGIVNFKCMKAEELHPVHAADDRPDTSLALSAICSKVFLIDQPWNRTEKWRHKFAGRKNIIRVKSLLEMMEYITG
jgi:hypothetical protein